jgi:shikimate dehydrogenase
MNRVGIIGYPLSHTLSPAMHNAAFKHLGMEDWLYDAMEIPPDVLRLGVAEPKRHGYIGINVTIPFKQEVMTFCRPDEIARAVGAVNTLDFRTDIGTNTDVGGFIADLQAHNIPLKNETVVVLGAGGAARAAVYGLWQQGANIIVVNRTPQKAYQMLTDLTLSAGVQHVRVLSLEAAADNSPSLIVNSTSAGMYPHADATPWDNAIIFPKGVTVYDMVYRPSKTLFMKQAEANYGRAIGGLGMLVRQGAAAFKLWTGVEPPLDVMFETVRSALETAQHPVVNPQDETL